MISATLAPVKTDVSTLVSKYLKHIRYVDGRAKKTYDNRKYILEPFFRELNIPFIEDVTIYDVDEYAVRHCLDKKSTKSMKRRIVRSFLKWCYEYKELNLAFDPNKIEAQKYKPVKKRVFSREEVQQVIATTPHVQDRLIISLMFETGMRIGEVINLRIHDIMGVSIQIRGKGETDRIVCMPPDLARAMREYATSRGYTSGRMFRPLQKQRNHKADYYVSDYGVRDRIKREFAKHGIKMYPHQLRHSFAVDWLQRGGDIRTLQMLMGHESIETTQWYLHLTDQHLKDNYMRNRNQSVFA